MIKLTLKDGSVREIESALSKVATSTHKICLIILMSLKAKR